MVKKYSVPEGINIAKAVQKGFKGTDYYVAYISSKQVDDVLNTGADKKDIGYDLKEYLLRSGLKESEVVNLEHPYQPVPFDKLKKNEIMAVYNQDRVEHVKMGLYKAKDNYSLKDALLGIISCEG